MMSNKKSMKAENYSSELLDSMLDAITPEQQKSIDRKMMLAAKIYDAMKAKGWNQKTFAAAIGKQQSEISKWLSGTHTFTSDTLWTIGDNLGIELLPVKEISKVVEVKYVPIVIKAEISEGIPNTVSGIFDDSSLIPQEGYYFIKQYSSKVNIGSTKAFNIHADC